MYGYMVPLTALPGQDLFNAFLTGNSSRINQSPLSACSTVPSFPIRQLPDAVLLHILKHCDQDTRQAAYQSCKEFRDLCNGHMKSVSVELGMENSLKAVKEGCSKTLCPKAAYGKEKLVVRINDYKACKSFVSDCIFKHLELLLSNAFMSANTHPDCRTQQLANVASIDLHLKHLDGVIDTTEEHCKVLVQLLSQFSKLQNLQTGVNGLVPLITTQHLKQLHCTRPVTHEELLLVAKQHPHINTLEFLVAKGADINAFKPALLQLQELKHLSIASQSAALFPASLLTPLTQLSTLAINNVGVTNAHLLQQLHITSLTLKADGAYVRQWGQQQQQQQPAVWPFLKSVKFVQMKSGLLDVTESLARAILPLPHPGFNVEWPADVQCVADVPPHPQFGYMAIAHMASMKFWCLRMTGQHVKPALQATVQHQTAMLHLSVDGMHGKPSALGCDDVATCSALNNLVDLCLNGFTIDTLELFRQVFLHCPMLRMVSVGRSCLPKLRELPSFLKAPHMTLFNEDDVFIKRPEPENMADPWS